MANPVDLTLVVSADVAAAQAGFEHVSAAASDMASEVDRAATTADDASSRMEGLASSTDDVASKTGLMTGAMGALAGGLSAVGLEKYGTALEGAAIATDTISGASDLLTLALESQKVQWILNAAKTAANTVVTVAGTVATEAMAAAQKALNLVMAASPIGLVVVAVGLLVAGLVLAYQKSETFRQIVDSLGQTAATVFGKIVGFVGDVVAKLADLWSKGSQVFGDLLGAAQDFATDAWNAVKGLIDDITGGIGGIVHTVAGHFSDMFAPIQTAIGWVQDLIDKISNIHMPDLPDLNPLNRGVAGTDPRLASTQQAQPVTHIDITVQGAIDPDSTARQIVDVLDRYARRTQTGTIVMGR